MMTKIQVVLKRIIVNQTFRQALIEGPASLPQGERIDSSAEMSTGIEYIYNVLAGLKFRQIGLKKRLISLFRAVFPGSDREASIWRVFSVEYGPDDPITRAIDSEAHSARRHHFVDHYRRSV